MSFENRTEKEEGANNGLGEVLFSRETERVVIKG